MVVVRLYVGVSGSRSLSDNHSHRSLGGRERERSN